MRKLTFIAATLAAILLAAGCATYKSGAGDSTLGGRTIWVAPAVNQSYMPQVATAITERVREAFLQDNERTLARRDDADTRLDITVTEIEREGHAPGLTVPDVTEQNGAKNVVSREDRGLYKAYDVILSARAVLTDSKTGKVLFDHEFVTTSQSLPSPYTTTSADQERLLIPILARDLARQIHDSIAHGWAAKTAPAK
jgi:hypothetical protein